MLALAVVVASLGTGASFGSYWLWSRPSPYTWQPPVPPAFSPGQRQVSLVFAGDVSVARGIGANIDSVGKGDPAWLLAGVEPVFRQADLVFANLECVLSDDDTLNPADKTFTIRGRPADARALVAAGIDVVSVANNHAMDFRFEGFFDTLDATRSLGLIATGVLEEERQRLVVVEVGTMKVGFLAYNAQGDEWLHYRFSPRAATLDFEKEFDTVLADVRAARPQVDQLVVSVHWGPELSHLPWPWQVDGAHALVEAGADLVIGHHPHVEQPVEEYRGALIAYSLGDLSFDKKAAWLRSRTRPRFLLVVDFDGMRRSGFRLVPIDADDRYRPRLAQNQDTASLLLPPSTSWTASGHIEEARVVRAGRVCDAFATERPKLTAGFLRWLERRWLCGDDDKDTPLAVGASGELSATVLRRGVWASPANDDVTVSYARVPLRASLHLVAGFPDDVLEVEPTAKTPSTGPATVELRIDGAVVHSERVPFVAGWRDADIDTSRLPPGSHDVDVVVRGPRRALPGFLFELEVR